MTDETIRPGSQSDGPRICEVFRASRSAALPWLPVLHSPEEDLAFFTGQVRDHRSWVAVHEDSVIGFAISSPGWLDHLYLHPAWQGRGIGSRLLAEAKNANPDGLDLWVFERNVPAQAFYQHHGFVEIRRTDGAGNEEKEPDVLMRWSPA